MKRTLILLSSILLAAGTVQAGETSFQELISGKSIPLTVKLKELTADWRRINTGSAGSDVASAASRAYAMAMGLGGGSGAIYTKGETRTAEGETYLVAYRFTPKPIDMNALMRGRPDAMPQPEKPTPDALLTLCLVHLRTTDSFTDVRPFDLEVELAGGDSSPSALEEAREKAAKAGGLQNLRAIGVALLAYAQDGDKTLPAMPDAETARKALEPYCKLKGAFENPDTQQAYLPNASLSGKKFADIAKPGEIVAYYESKPANDMRAVLYLDGKAVRIPETKWADLKKASGIQ
jgi:hypothetical protein